MGVVEAGDVLFLVASDGETAASEFLRVGDLADAWMKVAAVAWSTVDVSFLPPPMTDADRARRDAFYSRERARGGS